jgi:GT2 family glycosyltransferase
VSKDQCFAKNVNEGLQKYKGDQVLVLNNDVIPLSGWAEWLMTQSYKGIVSMTQRADCGWAWGTSRENQEKIGLLDENLVNSYEDYDYFIRASILGLNRILAPMPYMIHEGGHTINSIWGTFEENSSVRQEACLRNKEYMLKKWPGVPINSVPSSHWALNGSRLIQEYLGAKK